MNAAWSVSLPFITPANTVADWVSASVMNGGHGTPWIWLAAAVNCTPGVEEPDSGTVMFLYDELLSSGRYVGNSDDGAVLVMFHDASVAFSHSANSAASLGCLLCEKTG